jgi:hypothetical protein
MASIQSANRELEMIERLVWFVCKARDAKGKRYNVQACKVKDLTRLKLHS